MLLTFVSDYNDLGPIRKFRQSKFTFKYKIESDQYLNLEMDHHFGTLIEEELI